MARRIRPTALFVLAVLLAAPPAFAQFGSIDSNPPPRPPADVPNAPPSQQQPPPYYPSGRDTPPSQPLPAPMNLPPSNRPGAGSIQSQPLPPPQGGVVAPAPPPGQRPQQDVSTPSQPPTALPPGPGSPRNAPQQTNTAPQPNDEVVVEPPPQRITNPTAVFSGLDKITGRIISFDVAINETVQFGALQVTPRVCYSRPPTETPNTDAFVEVDEVTLQGEIKGFSPGGCSPRARACTRSSTRSTMSGSPNAKAGAIRTSPKCRLSKRRSRRRGSNNSNRSSAAHRLRHSRSGRRRPPAYSRRLSGRDIHPGRALSGVWTAVFPQ
jgi:hypothetical protein